MTIQHHLSDDLLTQYAAGSLAEGWSIAVATHLALCPTCRARLKRFEQIGGQLFEALPAEPIEESSWQQVRSRLSHSVDVKPKSRNLSSGSAPILTEPLRSYIGGDVASIKWKPLGLGAYHFPISTSDGETRVRLLKIPAGKPVPEHSHGGRELTLVLSGSFVDGADVFARGDIEETDSEMTHQPVATPDMDCICLAVTDAPLRFKSLFVRMVQPILGI